MEHLTDDTSVIPGEELRIVITEAKEYGTKDNIRALGAHGLCGYFEYDVEKILKSSQKAGIRYRCFMEDKKDEHLCTVHIKIS